MTETTTRQDPAGDQYAGQDGTDRAHREGRHDVRALFRAVGVEHVPPTGTGHRRMVRSVDPASRDVTEVSPLTVVGFADGVQAQKLVRHQAHRPVTLVWVAAAVVGLDSRFLRFRQRLALVGSAADADRLAEWGQLARELPVHLLEDLTPWGVATATPLVVDQWRREMEADVLADVAIPDGQHVVVDGSIRHHVREGLVGVVKATDTQYLPDESAIPDRAGWRSPVFALPATTIGERDVVSCYLRLHDAPGTLSWSHSLVRIEARNETVLDAACALALRHRQSRGSGDPRWATHLRGMNRTESVIRAFMPQAFEV